MRSQLGPIHVLAQGPRVTWAVTQALQEGSGPSRTQQSYQDLISPLALDGKPPPHSLPLWFGRCWVHSVDMPASFQIYWNLIFTLGKVAPE